MKLDWPVEEEIKPLKQLGTVYLATLHYHYSDPRRRYNYTRTVASEPTRPGNDRQSLNYDIRTVQYVLAGGVGVAWLLHVRSAFLEKRNRLFLPPAAPLDPIASLFPSPTAAYMYA